MGVSLREYLKYGDKGPTSRGGGLPTESARTTLYKGHFKHHWSYYKARAQKARSKAEKEA